ncbi:hypothetical protein BBJ28_00026665, partial [Nothophytophthora sp. Chile5]
MPVINCDYAPGCTATFARKSRKDDHVTKVHGGPGQLFCTECSGRLQFFKHAKSFATHVRNVHAQVHCPYCSVSVQPKNLSRHQTKCQSATAAQVDASLETEEKTDDVIPFEQEPVFRSEQDADVRRAPHRAPTQDFVDDRMKGFLDWYSNPNSLGRDQRGISSDDFASKFRTVLGKMATHFELTDAQVIKKLNSGERQLETFLTPEKIDSLMRSMGTRVDGKTLHPSTRYNQLRPLVVFLQWLVDIKRFKTLEDVKDLVHQTSVAISKQRKRAQRVTEKADRLADLPGVDQFVEWLEHDLRDKFDAEIARSKEQDFDVQMYIAARDFFLVMLMCAVPPQRLQLLKAMSLQHMSTQRTTNMVYFKIPEHKTSHLYGQAVMFIPGRFKRLFIQFLTFRRAVLSHQAQALDNPKLIDVHRVFISTDGKPDKYLTARFQQLVQDKF